jgi:hypothetical protein
MEYRFFDAKLVERGRDAACAHALKHNYAWILQIDADATFPPTTLVQLLQTAFVTHPHSSAVGAYCQLSAGMNIPTIDTGTGTWEIQFPEQGVLEVIRTGGHCLLVKTEALKRFGPPWFRSRIPHQPAKAFAEVDNFARCKLDGVNPLTAHPEWATLVAEARRGGQGDLGIVGEDSGFCDALRAAGGRIFVNTDVVTGHVAKKIIGPEDLKTSVSKIEKNLKLAMGIL